MFSNQFQQFDSKTNKIYLLKDFNINLEPTQTKCSASTLFDHILTNSSEKVSQKGVIDVGISNHQFIYCTRKTKRIKHHA